MGYTVLVFVIVCMSKLSANLVLDEFYSINNENQTDYEMENDYKTSVDKYKNIPVNELVNNSNIDYNGQSKNTTLHDLGLTLFVL